MQPHLFIRNEAAKEFANLGFPEKESKEVGEKAEEFWRTNRCGKGWDAIQEAIKWGKKQYGKVKK